MEGDGEGLLAIVQSLNASGVTLTVVNRPQEQEYTEMRRSPRPKRIEINSKTMPTFEQRSTDASTEFPSTTTTGVQICDGRYASSYKLAHCRMIPTSPPERVSEFPPQRTEPCRNRGNFEVGGHVSGQIRATSAKPMRYGGTQTCGGRESVHRSKSTRGTDAFVHSLRKYPSMTPVGSVSTDLIEKLIRFTQSKHSPRTSSPTKSMRSLHKDRSLDNSDIYKVSDKVSKHQQTYTRTRPRNESGANNAKLSYKGRTRNFKLYSPMSDNRNFKYRETPFSSSYDYLKAGNSRHYDRPDFSRPNRSDRDVRQTDVSRYIRSAIRQIYNGHPLVFQVCPKLKNRYNQHKNNSCTIRDTTNVVNDEKDQASTTLLSRILASFSGCEMPSTAAGFKSPISSKIYCHKTSQCSCKPDACTSTSFADFDAIKLSKSKYCHCCPITKDKYLQGSPTCQCTSVVNERQTSQTTCHCGQEDKAYHSMRIDEEISDWLKDVPIQSIESPRQKWKRDNMVRQLGLNLKWLPDDDNFYENASVEIENFINELPMWYPGTKKDEEHFKRQLANKLSKKILDIPRKPDRFRDAVQKWLKGINFKTKDDVNTKSMIDNIVKKLQAQATDRPESDSEYKLILQKEIYEMLEDLPVNIQDNKDIILNKTAKLVADIVNIPKDIDFIEDRGNLEAEFEEQISDWLNEFGVFNEKFDGLNTNFIEKLARKLNKLQSHSIGDKNVEEQMKEEIYKFLADLDIPLEMLDELTNELFVKLTDAVQTNYIENLDQEELKKEIIDWLQNIPGITDIHPRKFNMTADELKNKIKEAKQQGIVNYQNDIIDCIANAFSQIDPVILARYVEKLMETLQNWPSKKQYKDNAKEKIINGIDNAVDAARISEEIKRELKVKFIEMIRVHLDNSLLDSEKDQDDMKEVLLEEIDNVINKIHVSEDRRSDLKCKLGDALINNFDKSLSGLKKDGCDVKQTIKRDIGSVVRTIPIDTNKKNIFMQQVKAALAKNLNKPLSEDIRDTINERISNIIDESPISKDKEKMSNLKTEILNFTAKDMDKLWPQNKYIRDIKGTVTKDVSIVIENSPIDIDRKIYLKQKIQEILTENIDKPLLECVKESMKEEIIKVVEELPIPTDDKNILKNQIENTVAKSFDKALSALGKNINEVKNKIVKNISYAIEKSPISRSEKKHLKNKLKDMLSATLDLELSDKVKDTVMEDVSNIVNDAPIPKGLKSRLKNKLTNIVAKQLHLMPTQRKFTKDVKDIIEKEVTSIFDEAQIPNDKKNQLKESLKNKLNKKVDGSPSDIKNKIKEEILDVIENSSIPEDKRSEFKSKMMNVFYRYFESLPIESYAASNDFITMITKDIISLIDQLPIEISEKTELKRQIDNMLAETSHQRLSDVVIKSIKDEIFNILNEALITENIKNSIQSKITNTLENDVEVLLSQGKDVGNIKNTISKNISNTIDGSAISEEKKNYLKQKFEGSLAKNLIRPLSDELTEAIKERLNNIIDGSAIVSDRKGGLKKLFTDIVTKNFVQLQTRIINQSEIKGVILQGVEDIIEQSPIPKEKKIVLREKLKCLAIENLKQPLSDDLYDMMILGISNILDQIPLSNDKINNLKSQLTDVLDENMDYLHYDRKETGAKQLNELKSYTQDSILQRIENTIEQSPVPSEKKTELKKKIKDMMTKAYMKPLCQNNLDLIKDDVRDTIDQLPLSKDQKSDLKNKLSSLVDENIDTLLEDKKERATYRFKELKTRTQDSVLEGIENTIEQSPISNEKKIELKNILKYMLTEALRKPLSEDKKDTKKDGISNNLDEQTLSKEKKVNLKNKVIDVVDENMDSLRNYVNGKDINSFEESKTRAADNILRVIDNTVEQSPISNEKKMEIKKKLKDMMAEIFIRPLSDNSQNMMKDGINSILDEVPLAKHNRNNLKQEITGVVNKIMDSLPFDLKEDNTKYLIEQETRTQDSILQGIENTIEQSPISNEKKIELKKILSDMMIKVFRKPDFQDKQDKIKYGISNILDEELSLSKGKKNNLKNQLTNIVSENVDILRNNVKENGIHSFEKSKSRTADSILQGIIKTIEQSPISNEKKIELNKKLKDMVAEIVIQPFSDNSQDVMKDGINNILDQRPLSNDKKYNMKHELTDVVTEIMDPLHFDIKQEDAKGLREPETRTQDRILQKIEDAIEQSPVSNESKMALKKILRDMTEASRKPDFQDKQDKIKHDLSNILSKLPLSEEKKNNLKNKLTDIVDENMDILRNDVKEKDIHSFEASKTHTADCILQGIIKTIEQSPISNEKKIELNKKLKDMVAEIFVQPLTANSQDVMKDSINNILDRLPLSNDKKNNLKLELPGVATENIGSLHFDIKEDAKGLHELETRTQESLSQGIENAIEQSPVSSEKKMEIKKILRDMMRDAFRKPDFQDKQDKSKYGLSNILDELPLSKEKKKNLKNKLTDIVDKNMDILRNDVKEKDIHSSEELKTHTADSILQEIMKTIEQSPISNEKKIELNEKLKDMVAEIVIQPHSANFQNVMNDGINNILEMPLSKYKKYNLKNELTDVVNENMDSLHYDRKEKDDERIKKVEIHTQDSILQEFENTVEQSPISNEKKTILKDILNDMMTKAFRKPISQDNKDTTKDAISIILDELPLSKKKSNNLKNELTDTKNKNMDALCNKTKEKPIYRFKELETRITESILQGIDNTIEHSQISNEKKIELKKKLKDKMNVIFKKPLSDNSQVMMKDGINNILDELPLTKHIKNNIKQELADVVYENMNILYHDIKEKDAAIKDGISNILDELSLSKDEKNKLEVELGDIYNKYKSKVPHIKPLQMRRKGFGAPITKEKKQRKSLLSKIEVDECIKEEIQDVLTKHNINSNDIKNIEMNICDELKDVVARGGDMENAKGKLKQKIMQHTNLPDVQADDLSGKLISRSKELTLLAKATDSDSRFDKVRKTSSNHRLTKLSDKEFLDSPETLIVGEDNIYLTDGIVYNANDEDMRDKVLFNTNLVNVPTVKKPEILRKHFKAVIPNAVSNFIDQAPTSKNLKSKLKSKLLRNLTKTLAKSPLTQKKDIDDVKDVMKDGINNILDELPLSKHEKNNLKHELTDVVNEKIDILYYDIKEKDAAIKDGISNTLDELPLSKDDKIKLEVELGDIYNKYKSNVKHIRPLQMRRKIVGAPITKEKTQRKSLLSKTEVDECIKEEIQDVLRKENINSNDIKNIETNIGDELEDVLVRGGDVKNAKQKIKQKIMQYTNFPDLQADDLSGKLISRAEQLTLLAKATDLDRVYDKVRKTSSNHRLTELSDKEFLESPETSIVGEENIYLINGVVYNTDDEDMSEKVLSNTKLVNVPTIKKPAIVRKRLKKVVSKAVSNFIDQSPISETLKSKLKSKLLRKLTQTLAKSPLNRKKDIDDVKDLMLNDTINIVNESSIPIVQKNSLKFQLTQLLATELDGIMDMPDTSNVTNSDEYAIVSSKKTKPMFKEPQQKSKDYSVQRSTDEESTLLAAQKNKTNAVPAQAFTLKKYRRMTSSDDPISNSKRDPSFQDSTENNPITSTPKRLIKSATKKVAPMSYVATDQEYIDELTDSIGTWLNNVPIDLDPKVKLAVMKDLACDILDREKYLHVKPGGNSSNQDELANLKYQIYRRLDRVVNSNDLASIMQRTEQLLENLNKMKVAKKPLRIPILQSSGQKEEEHVKRRRSDSMPQKRRKSVNTSVLEDSSTSNERLSKDLDDVIDKLPISISEKNYLKDKLTKVLSNDETEPVNMEHLISENKPNDTSYYPSIPDSSQYFVPSQHSTPKKNQETKSNLSPTTTKVLEEPVTPLDNSQIEYTRQINDAIGLWMEKSLNKLKLNSEDKKSIVNGLTNDIVDRKKYLQLTPGMHPTLGDELDYLKYQVYRRVNNLVGAEDMASVIKETEELLGKIVEVEVPLKTVLPEFNSGEDSDQEDRSIVEDIIEIVNDWIHSTPIIIKNDQEKQDFENKKQDFILKLHTITPHCEPEELKKEIKYYMLQMHLKPEMRNDDHRMNEKVGELVDALYRLQRQKTRQRQYGMSYNGLSDFIENWMDNLHIDDETKDDDEIKAIKKGIAFNLLQKIGAMNIDPEIFQDELLYENVLSDEIDGLLDDLTITDHNISEMKADLIDKVKEAQRRVHDEMAGQSYKQNLRNTILQVLPDQGNISLEGKATMDIMQDQLADAFINLHYAGNNEELKTNIKNKIASEINKFCNDYLHRYPAAPLESWKLKRDLYKALKQVSIPPEGSMRYEVEQGRIRAKINDWVAQLPLETQTPAELLTRNKMIYVLSKKLFDIELENYDAEGIPKMRKEIERFQKKLPLKPGQIKNTRERTDKLIDLLKATQSSRRFSEFSIIDIDDDEEVGAPGVSTPVRGVTKANTDESMSPYNKHLLEKQKAGSRNPAYGHKQSGPSYPPCTLSSEDMAHLEIIRQRTCLSPKCLSSLLNSERRNAGVGPLSVDAGSQTELNPGSVASGKPQSPNSPSANRQASPLCSSIPPQTASNKSSNQERKATIPSIPFSNTDTRGEVQPHIIIKEYYWDTADGSKLQESVSQQPLPQSFGPQKAPCGTFPCPGSKPQRYPHCSQQKTFQIPQHRSSHGSLAYPRPPRSPSPCVSPSSQPYTPNQQSSPLNSPGISFRHDECRMPKRDGLQDQNPSTSRPSRKERVIELGSLDDLCEPRSKRNDNFDWTYAKFPDEDNFWGMPCMRRVILDEGIDEPLMMEREKREERVRCKCQERLLPKCAVTRSKTYSPHVYQTQTENANHLKGCSKCCGLHCPYPSYLYFRQ